MKDFPCRRQAAIRQDAPIKCISSTVVCFLNSNQDSKLQFNPILEIWVCRQETKSQFVTHPGKPSVSVWCEQQEVGNQKTSRAHIWIKQTQNCLAA